MKELKAGSAYIEIIAKADQLKAQLSGIESDAKKTAEKFKDYFRTLKLDIDNRILTMKFNDLMGLHKALKVQLDQKIKLNADVASIEKTRIALSSVQDAIGKMHSRAGGYNAGVGMSFNRIIQDSAYVTQGFGFWMNAVGNNVTNFAENIQYARARGDSFKSMFSGMFTGMNAWMLGLNLVVSAITAFSLSSREAKKETEAWDLSSLIGDTDAYAKSLAGVRKELSELSDVQLGKKMGELNKELVEQERIITNIQKAKAMGTIYKIFVGGNEKEAIEKIIETKATLNELNNMVAVPTKGPNFIRKQIEELQKSFDLGDKSVIPKIKSLKAELKGWTDLLEDSKSKKDSASLKDLKADLNDWVKMLYEYQRVSTDIKAKGLDGGGLNLDFTKRKGVPVQQMFKNLENVDDVANPFKEVLRDINKELEDGARANERFADTLSGAFTEGIMSGQTLGEIFNRLAVQLAAMVIQAVAFKAIMAVLNTLTGGFLSELGLTAKVATPDITATPLTTGMSMSRYSVDSGGIISALNNVDNSIRSGTIANIKGRSQPFIIYMDSKVLAEGVIDQQNDFDRGNVKRGRG